MARILGLRGHVYGDAVNMSFGQEKATLVNKSYVNSEDLLSMKNYLNPRVVCALCTLLSFLVAGCPGSDSGSSAAELFTKSLLDPIPKSVEGLRINTPESYSDPVYVLGFKCSHEDFQAILKARPFVEYDEWEFDTPGVLRWTYSYETAASEKFIVYASVALDKDSDGRHKPQWFRPDQWSKSRFYAYIVNRNPSNSNHNNRHILIYSMESGEACYIKSMTGGL